MAIRSAWPTAGRAGSGCSPRSIASVDLAPLAHQDAARRIAADDIDILVDLNGCNLGARPRILAHRPAKLQINYLGYTGTMARVPGAPASWIMPSSIP